MNTAPTLDAQDRPQRLGALRMTPEPRQPTVFGMCALDNHDFEIFKAIISKQFGIELKPHSRTTLEARLGRRLKQLGLTTYGEYIDRLAPGSAEFEQFSHLVTTHHTFFYREPEHFAHLREVALPELNTLRRDEVLEMWSAACSTGEETFTLAIEAAEHERRFKNTRRFHLLGTDISTPVVERARQGIYPKDCVEELPLSLLKRYFLRGRGEHQNLARVTPSLRTQMTFRTMNLMNVGDISSTFDVIFCRNVMIYFGTESQKRVLSSLIRALRPNGYLYLGHSESLLSRPRGLINKGRSIYQKREG